MGKRKCTAVVLHESATGHQAARAMKDNNVGCVLVCDRGGRLTGILTDRDLVLRGLAEKLDAGDTELRYLMTMSPAAIDEKQSVEDALWMMTSLGVRRVPVVNRRGKPQSVITLDDLLAGGRGEPASIRAVVRRQQGEPARLRLVDRPAPKAKDGTPLLASVESLSPEEFHLRVEESGDRHHRAHEQQSLGRIVHLARMCLEDRALFVLDHKTVESGLRSVLTGLVRRLNVGVAANLIEQLPSALKEELYEQPAGPDTRIGRKVIERLLRRRMNLKPAQAGDALEAMFEALAETITRGQFRAACAQLPGDLKMVAERALNRSAEVARQTRAAG